MHLDNFLFPLLLAVAALFKLLTSKAGDAARKKSEPPPQRSISTPRTDQPPPIPTADTDQERIRDFLEALGQPTSSKPPRKLSRPTYQKPITLPHLPPFASPLPPLVTRPPEEPTRKITRMPPVITPVVEPSVLTPAAYQAPVFEVQGSALAAEQTAAIATGTAATDAQTATEQPGPTIAALLSSRSGLRDAIILREIFGPPRSLQSLHLVGGA
jgi:hypothetical protein